MASKKILEQKKATVEEIKSKLDNNKTFLLLNYRGLTVENDIIEPIKVVSKFMKDVPALEVRIGYIDKEVVGVDVIKQYADIPSMEGLLTMFAGGLIEHLRNLSIGLNLYAEKLEKGGNE